MPDVQKRLALALCTTAVIAEPGWYKANEAGNINTVIRGIHVNNESAGSVTFTMALIAAGAADAVGKRLWTGITLGPYATLDWSGFLVMNPNEWLTGFASVTSVVTVMVSGILAT